MEPTKLAEKGEARITILECCDSAITWWVSIDCNRLSRMVDAYVALTCLVC